MGDLGMSDIGTTPTVQTAATPISNPALSPPPYAPQADPYIFGSEASDFSEVATASAPPSSPSAPPARVALPGGDGVSNVNPAWRSSSKLLLHLVYPRRRIKE
jgi:hypothetical protein